MTENGQQQAILDGREAGPGNNIPLRPVAHAILHNLGLSDRSDLLKELLQLAGPKSSGQLLHKDRPPITLILSQLGRAGLSSGTASAVTTAIPVIISTAAVATVITISVSVSAIISSARSVVAGWRARPGASPSAAAVIVSVSSMTTGRPTVRIAAPASTPAAFVATSFASGGVTASLAYGVSVGAAPSIASITVPAITVPVVLTIPITAGVSGLVSGRSSTIIAILLRRISISRDLAGLALGGGRVKQRLDVQT